MCLICSWDSLLKVLGAKVDHENIEFITSQQNTGMISTLPPDVVVLCVVANDSTLSYIRVSSRISSDAGGFDLLS